MFTEAYLEPSQTSTMKHFFTSVKGYFENVLNSIELPLGSMVYTTNTFVKKLTAQNFKRKSLLLTMEQFFPKFQITQGGITEK